MGVKPVVTRSIEDATGQRCVDLLARGGRVGWTECRRDAEDGHGWRHLGGAPALDHPSQEAALAEAVAAVPWLREAP